MHKENKSVTKRVYVFSGVCQQNFAGAGLLLAHLKIKMRQQALTLIFYYHKVE
jgi:hypothetical protein